MAKKARQRSLFDAAEQEPLRRLYDGPPEALIGPIRKLLADLAQESPLRPVLVFTPTSLARHYLQRTLALAGIATVNIHFTTLDGFVERLYPQLACRPLRPLPPGAERLLLAAIAPETLGQGYFAQVRDRSGFQLALLATINDLREACLTREELTTVLGRGQPPEELRELPEKLSSLVALWDRYDELRRQLGYVDLLDMYEEVIARLDHWPMLRQKPTCVFYGFYDFKGIQFRLLCGLAERCPVVVFMPYEESEAYHYARRTHDALAQELSTSWCSLTVRPGKAALHQVQRHLFTDNTPEAVPNDGSVRILCLPTSGSEPDFVVRVVAEELANGVCSDRIAVLTRDPELATRLRRACADHHITYVDLDHDGLQTTPFGQLVSGLLELAAEQDELQQFNREDVLHVLELAETLKDTRRDQSPFGCDLASLWDSLTRQAGIVSGRGEWEQRLNRLAAPPAQQTHGAEATETAEEDRMKAARTLRRLTVRLFDGCERLRGATSWSDRVGAIRDLCELLLGSDFLPGEVPTPVAEQRKEFFAVLEQLTPLATEVVSYELFADVVRSLLAAIPVRRDHEGRYMEGGVVIGDLMRARATQFDVVIVPGMASRTYPPPVRQDPILLDPERRWLNRQLNRDCPLYELPLRQFRADEERMLFRLAVGLATRRLVLCYARHESGRSRLVLPSAYLLDVFRALGRPKSFRELSTASGQRSSEFEWLSVNPAQREERWCFRGRDYLRREVLRAAGSSRVDPAPWAAVSAVTKQLVAALRGEHCRWARPEWTEFDGKLDGGRARELLRLVAPGGHFTVSHIDDFTQCGYYFLLAHGLQLEPDEDPTRSYRADPLLIGKLAHKVLERVFAELSRHWHGANAPSEQLVRNIAARMLQEVFDAVSDRAVGFPLIWQLERELLAHQLETVILEECKRLRKQGRWPHCVEHSFGQHDEPGVDLEIAGQVRLTIRGRIDRIDRDTEDQWYVIDYKRREAKGASKDAPGIQLPAYAMAAAKHAKLDEHTFAGLEYVYYQSQRRHVVQLPDFSDFESVRQYVYETAARAVSGLEAGCFFQQHGDVCKGCHFADVCLGLQQYLPEYKQGQTDADSAGNSS